MSTRGKIGIKYDGEIRIHFYNHSDSYPSWLGENLVKFIQRVEKDNGWEFFKEKCKNLKIIDEDGKPTMEQFHKYVKFIRVFDHGSLNDPHYKPMLRITRCATEWYALLHGLQGATGINAIYDGEANVMCNGKDIFEGAYSYVFNLDDHVLEFYTGNISHDDEYTFIKAFPFHEMRTHKQFTRALDAKKNLKEMQDIHIQKWLASKKKGEVLNEHGFKGEITKIVHNDAPFEIDTFNGHSMRCKEFVYNVKYYHIVKKNIKSMEVNFLDNEGKKLNAHPIKIVADGDISKKQQFYGMWNATSGDPVKNWISWKYRPIKEIWIRDNSHTEKIDAKAIAKKHNAIKA